MIGVIASYRVMEGKVDEARAVINEFLKAVRREKGTKLYEAMQSERRPRDFVHVMKFKDAEAEEKHRNSAHVKHFAKQLYPLCVIRPKFSRFKEI